MSVLGESLLSVFVIGIVPYVYLLAAAAALFDVCGLAFIGRESEASHHFGTAT
jgi:hypothetical protein